MGLWSEVDLKNGKLSDGRGQTTPGELIKDNEIIMPETENDSENKSLEIRSEETQLTGSKKHYETMKTGLLDSVNLIDSTTNELQSQMKGLAAQSDERKSPMYHQMDKVNAVAGIARGINDLLKTKVTAIKTLQEVVDNEPYEINPEEYEDE